MALDYTLTDATDRSSIVRGDVGIVSGTWTLKSGSSGTIVTGGGTVLAHSITCGSAAVQPGSAIVLSWKNKSRSNVDAWGTIYVRPLGSAISGQSGDWWAIVRV